MTSLSTWVKLKQMDILCTHVSSARVVHPRSHCRAIRQVSSKSQEAHYAGSEVDRYLDDSSSEITSVNCYPHIKQLFVALNTGLPASAAVERLFSLGGRVFTPLRTR